MSSIKVFFMEVWDGTTIDILQKDSSEIVIAFIIRGFNYMKTRGLCSMKCALRYSIILEYENLLRFRFFFFIIPSSINLLL